MVVVGGPVHYPAPNQAMWNIQYWLPKTFKSSHLRTTSFSPIVTAVHVGFSFAGILPFFFAVTSSTAAFFAPRLGVALCPIVVFLDKCTCCFPARSLPTSCWPSYWSSKGTSRWGIKRMVPWDGKKRGRWKWSRVLAHRDLCQRSLGGGDWKSDAPFWEDFNFCDFQRPKWTDTVVLKSDYNHANMVIGSYSQAPDVYLGQTCKYWIFPEHWTAKNFNQIESHYISVVYSVCLKRRHLQI